MTINFEAERTLLGGGNFNRAQLREAITEGRTALNGFQHREGPGAQRYADALSRLEGVYRNTQGSGQRLSNTARDEARTLAREVGAARLAAQRENLPNDQYMRNPGDDPGIYRERGSGEIVRRDPGARTATERAPVTSQNQDEPGIHRGADGNVVRRDPGATTALERSEQDGPYARSMREPVVPGARRGVYRDAAATDQVEGGARTFREGERGAGVREMQQLLQRAGFDLGPSGADGFYGPKTAAAVNQFLQREGFGDRRTINNESMARLRYLTNQSGT